MPVSFTEIRKRMQMTSGSVLAFYVLTHFINHSLGIWGLEALEQGRVWFNLVWRSWPGTFFLYAAVFCHFVLALVSIYERRTMKMPPSETIKVISGFILPFLLAQHVVATRVELALFAHDKSYPQILSALSRSPTLSTLQTIAVVVAWLHGCLGIWFWLRSKSWFAAVAPSFYMFTVAVPLMALFGFYAGMHDAALAPFPSMPWLDGAQVATLDKIRTSIGAGVPLLIALVLIVRIIPRKNRVQIRYAGGQIVTVSRGTSVLEASRLANIPHVSICGGRGRCSTCRVEVLHGLENQSAREERERKTLKKIGAPETVRLGCQFRPTSDVAVLPLVDADATTIARTLGGETATLGRERQIVALFCDIRGFTQTTEKKLPYDVVFLLNRYFALVGEAVESSGGMIDKFIGDGAVALFGLDTSYEQACRQALVASLKLARGIDQLNLSIGMELDQPLRIAIGLNGGTAIVGKIGYGRATTLTAVGDMMNTTSRLEGLAKEHDVELAVSADVIDRSGLTLANHDRRELAVRGREAMIETFLIPEVVDFAREIEASEGVKA